MTSENAAWFAPGPRNALEFQAAWRRPETQALLRSCLPAQLLEHFDDGERAGQLRWALRCRAGHDAGDAVVVLFGPSVLHIEPLGLESDTPESIAAGGIYTRRGPDDGLDGASGWVREFFEIECATCGAPYRYTPLRLLQAILESVVRHAERKITLRAK